MRFAQPAALLGLLLLPLLALFLRRMRARRATDLAKLGNPALLGRLAASVNQRGRRRRDALLLAALAFLMIALARPQWGSVTQTVEQEGAQLMVALDVSDSMLAQDLKPDRLSRAKLEIADLMSGLGGDEIGLVLFSGAAFVQFPLTSDYDVARAFLESARPGVISQPGTAIADAIRVGLTGLDQRRGGEKVIVVITDGEDTESEATAAAEQAREAGARVYTVGLGTPEGSPIPLFHANGQAAGFKLDADGQVVQSKLNEDLLRSIAEAGGGRYFRAGATGEGFAALAAEIEDLRTGQITSRVESLRIERYQLFLALALLLLGWRELIPDRLAPSRALAAGCLALLTLTGCASAEPAQLNATGNARFAEEDWEAAAEAYAAAQAEEPSSAALAYNLGNAAFRQEDVEGARRHLLEALGLDDGALTRRIHFNLGNLAFNLGDHAAAADSFKAVLRADPQDADAKHNLELALLAMQSAEEQQQQQDGESEEQQESGESEQDQQAQGEQQEGEQGQEQQQEQGESGQQAQGQDQQGAQEGQEPQDQGQQGQGQEPREGEESQQASGGEGNQENEAEGSRPQDGEPGGQAGGGMRERQLDPLQAYRLLQALGGNARTLQEYLQQRYVVPGGRRPAQDW